VESPRNGFTDCVRRRASPCGSQSLQDITFGGRASVASIADDTARPGPSVGHQTGHVKKVTGQHALRATAMIAPLQAAELGRLPAEKTSSLRHANFITAQGGL
jgi:hypothetical protein